MTEALEYTVNGVCPLLILIVVGYCMRLIGILKTDTAKGINKLCFKLLLPCSLFKSVYGMQEGASINGGYLAYCIGGIFVEIVLAILVGRTLLKDRKKIGSFTQGVFRGNFVLLGLPFAASLFGEEGTTIVSTLMPFTVFLYNALAVIVLSYFAADNSGMHLNIGKLLLEILKNPLIISIAAGWLLRLLPFRIPTVFMTAIGNIGGTASPIAVLVLGAQFDPGSFRNNLGTVFTAAGIRLIVYPAIACAIGIALGFTGNEIGCMFILFGTPTAVSSHIMAINQGCDGDLAGDILVATTGLSLVTIFTGVFVLKLTGIIG